MSVRSGEQLTPKQERAIVALLAEPTVEKAAESSGISKQTLYRWLSEPAFSASFRKTRRDAFKHAVSLCQKFVPHAVQALVQIIADKTAPHSARVSAATSLMKFGRESIELDDVVERVERLEQTQKETEHRD